MKALFNGVRLERIVGLGARANAELTRMATDFAAERRAAGRSVPADIGLAHDRRRRLRTSRMKMIDPHVHMTSRTTDDYVAMAAAGISALVEPAFWLGQPRTTAGSFVDYFNSLLGWERFRASQFGIRHFCTIGLNPKEANNPKLAGEVIDLLPRYLAKDGVVAVGELGFDDQTDDEARWFARQLELARDFNLPVLVHTPHRDKKQGTIRTIELIRSLKFPEERVLIDHNNEETLPIVLEHRLLGRALDLSEHEDGRAPHGGAGEEVRRRSHDRQQRGRLGDQRSAEGARRRPTPCAPSASPRSRFTRWCGTTR